MSQCRFRASDGAYKLRSQVLGYLGSTEAIKSLVEPLMRFVQPASERMDFVQRGVLEGVSPMGKPASPYVCQRAHPGTAPVTAHGTRPLAPPPSSMALGDSPQFFPAFSRHNFCLFFPTKLHQPKGAFQWLMN